MADQLYCNITELLLSTFRVHYFYILEVTAASEVLRVETIYYLLVKYLWSLELIMSHIIVKGHKIIENVYTTNRP